LIVGGMTPFCMVSSENAASIAPAADSVWPIIDLLDETGIDRVRGPNTVESDRCSILSFSGVEVPCALT
jgi:hypothetical protein